jgi:hypothetical protein
MIVELVIAGRINGRRAGLTYRAGELGGTIDAQARVDALVAASELVGGPSSPGGQGEATIDPSAPDGLVHNTLRAAFDSVDYDTFVPPASPAAADGIVY